MSKVTLILRGYTYEEVDMLAELLCDSKHVKNIEITLNTDNAFDIIKRISDKYKDRLNVGAGTVKTLGDLKSAVKSGARFVLSPVVMTQEMIDYCKKHNVISIPGAYTPSEIYTMYEMGADIIKVFPANESSYGYAKKVKEPCGDIPLMAVGGVSVSNALDHLNGGYDYLGSAGGIFKKEDIKNRDIETLKTSLKMFDLEIEERQI